MKREEITNKLIEQGAVAVIRLDDADRFPQVADALIEGGITALEITMTVPNALKLIRSATRSLAGKAMIGAGSILDAAAAAKAIEAGATYIVSPVFKPEVIEAAHQRNVPAMPGCFTPTEIITAHEHGADIIKVFPADVLGMPFFKGVKAPMPFLRMMPTGGVTPANAGDWLNAGACAVGVGSSLVDKKAIAAGNYQLLTEKARELVASIQAVRRNG